MKQDSKSTRRELLGMGLPTLATAALVSNSKLSADDTSGVEHSGQAPERKPWTEE